MTPRRAARAAPTLVVLLVITILAGCAPSTTARAPATAVLTAPVQSNAQPRLPYVQLTDAIVRAGGAVWIEVDLVAAWRHGPAAFARAVAISTALSRRRGVEGIKIADELGYNDGLKTPQQVSAFLEQSQRAIHLTNPRALILVDMVVPQLGCEATRVPTGVRADCLSETGNRYPAASIDAVDSYLALGVIDVLDVSAGLFSDAKYAAWGTTRDDAMQGAWAAIRQRRWGVLTRLQARKALAGPGGYRGSPQDAQRDVHTFVDIPLRYGAAAVDIWTWSQPYEGSTVTLTGPRLSDNPLTRLLRRRHAEGVKLITHMTPSSLQVSRSADVGSAMGMFDEVFVAAGAGSV